MNLKIKNQIIGTNKELNKKDQNNFLILISVTSKVSTDLQCIEF